MLSIESPREGSNPSLTATMGYSSIGLEHSSDTRKVGGSSPPIPTWKFKLEKGLVTRLSSTKL